MQIVIEQLIFIANLFILEVSEKLIIFEKL